MISAVAVVSDDQSERQIVAYLKLRTPNTSEQVREALYAQLPAYMVPSIFIAMESLPMLPNGKIDRRSLPSAHEVQKPFHYEEPRTEVEYAIASIWRETLGMEKVGRNDNFFQLGGHSLLLFRVHSQLNLLFERDLSMVDMFRYPTVQSLAEHLAGQDTPQFSGASETSEKRKQRRLRLQLQLKRRRAAINLKQ